MKKSLLFAAALVLIAIQSNVMASSIVGWHFSNGAFSYQSALASTDTAGAPGFAQANWNNGLGVGQGASPTPQSLNNSAGNPTGVALSSFTLATDNSWSMGDFTNADTKLLSDFADQSPSLSFTGVHSFTPDGYSVVVYYNNNEFFNSDSNLTVNGSTKEIFTSGVTTSYTQGGSGTSPSNYAVFTGVTGDVLNISLLGVNGTNNDGIAAVQIISSATPEPSSLILIAGGLTALVAVKLRRRTAK